MYCAVIGSNLNGVIYEIGQWQGFPVGLMEFIEIKFDRLLYCIGEVVPCMNLHSNSSVDDVWSLVHHF